MKKLAAILALWIICGIYTWGTVMADLDWKNHNEWSNLNLHARDNMGIASLEAAYGPMGAIALAFCTGFNEHGWELWEHHE
jgi:hypothetical protein